MGRTRGESMYPLIRDKNIVVIKKISNAQLEVGDIVVYKAGSGYIAHRLITKGQNRYLIRADNGIGSDELANQPQIVGKVIAIIRNKKLINIEEGFYYYCNYLLAILNRNFYFLLQLLIAIMRLLEEPRTFPLRLMRRLHKLLLKRESC